MIDHIELTVRNLTVSKLFYEAVLRPIGYRILRESDAGGSADGVSAELGVGPVADFRLRQGEPAAAVHVAFKCPNRRLVDEFHAAALAAGARDNGAPGLRPEHHSDYYSGYVFDPDGNNLEVVCHEPSGLP